VMTGGALTGTADYGGPAFGGDFTFWKVGGAWEQGIRFFKSHNLVYAGGAVIGHDLPFWNENTAGGNGLRGYLGQQFRGDTQLWGKVEYHFPLFSVGSLDFRALGFYDMQAVWYRDQPNVSGAPVPDPGATQPQYSTYVQRDTTDAR